MIYSGVNIISPHPSVGNSPKNNILLSLLPIYTDEVISASEIMTFFPMLPSVN